MIGTFLEYYCRKLFIEKTRLLCYDEIINKPKGTSKAIVFTNDDIENLLEQQYGKGEMIRLLCLILQR